MSEFQHTFTVRQHTPMIHFQADQDGAFLRVSELKPVFDRFLWEKVWTPSEDIEENAEMLISYSESSKEELINTVKEANYRWDDWSLDYSIEIEDIENTQRTDIDKFPCYFADLGKATNKPKLVYYESDFKITFTCFNDKLLKIIIERFPKFLCRTNFGTRKSKGFGSFTVIDPATFSPIVAGANLKGLYSYEMHDMNDKSFRMLFESIDLFWKTIRNGIDVPLKIPSALGQWVDSQKLQFDKNKLKKFVDLSKKEGKDDEDNEELEDNKHGFLYRDLLGLASTTEWKFQAESIEKISTDIEDKIERFMSPILIKPVRTQGSNYTIYIFVPKLDSGILNKEFDIKLKKNQSIAKYKTPEIKDDDFLRYFMDFVIKDYKRYFENSFGRSPKPEYVKLKSVFNSIKKISNP